jgi:thioesterase domain-containing protein/acyl carrier protein
MSKYRRSVQCAAAGWTNSGDASILRTVTRRPVIGMKMNQDHTIVKQTKPADIYRQSNLTRLQVLYWISQTLRPVAPFLNTVLTFTINGPVDSDRFEKAFQALLRQSDGLRIVIDEVDGVPQGRVLTTVDSTLQHLDFSDHPSPLAAARTWIDERSRTPLKLPERLFDTALIKTSPEQFIWYLNQHHIIADASSFFLIFERLAELYERSLGATIEVVRALPTFADYLVYERAYRESPQYLKAEAYWERKLNPGPEPIRFFGHEPVKKTTGVERITYDLGFERSSKLREVARQADIFTVSEELTLYNLFATLFFVQLYQLSGHRHLGFVTPVHNRFTEGFRNTIGLLMELCPLQVELSEDDTFMSLLKKVKRETRETMAHYQYATSLNLDSKTFDVMFNVYPTPVLTLNGAMVQAERIHPGHGSESFALHVNDVQASGRLILYFDFHRDVFDNAARDHVLQAFVQIVDEFLVDNFQRIEAISSVTLGFDSHSPGGGEGQCTSSDSYRTQNRLVREIVAPRDLLELQLCKIWEDVLDVVPIGISDNFFDLGGSSWTATRLFLKIQDVTGANLPLTTLLQATTVEELARLLTEKNEAELWSPIQVMQRGTSGRLPLFFVPGAGSNLLRLAQLVHHLDSDQPVYAFQVPGFEGEVEPYTRVEDVTSYFLEALRTFQPGGPYLVAGYSWGAIVAFELAQQLLSLGEEVQMLVLIDAPAQSQHLRLLKDTIHYLGQLLQLTAQQQDVIFLRIRDRVTDVDYFLRRQAKQDLTRGISRLNQLSLKWIWWKMTSYKSSRRKRTSKKRDYWAQFHLDPLRLKIVKINEQSLKQYIPCRYQGGIILFQSCDGDGNPATRSAAPQMGWSKIATEGVQSYVIPGHHLSMMDEPGARIIARHLQSHLDRVHEVNSPFPTVDQLT